MLSRKAKPKPENRNSLYSRFRRFAKTPKGYALGALTLLSLVGGLAPLGARGLEHAAIAAAAALAFDAIVARALARNIPFSVGGLITALIIADVLSPLTPIWVLLLTTFAALGSKHVLKRGRKPIFNPAAFGLLVSAVVFSTAQSWWAAMPLRPLWELAILLGVGIYVAWRVQKYAQVLMFLGTYFVLLMVMAMQHWGLSSATPADALRAPFLNSALFLAFFMTTDPPTSPATPRGQIQFGAIAAVVSVVVYALMGGLAYLLVGILVGNLWTVRLATARKPAQAPARAPKANGIPLWAATAIVAFVVGAGVTATYAAIHRGTAPPRAPVAAGDPASSASTPAPSTTDGTWSGTVQQSFGGEAGAVLTLSGSWNQSTLNLTLNGFSREGQFIIQSGQVTLTTQSGTVYQGQIQPSAGNALLAHVSASGGQATMTLQIGLPTLNAGGTRFSATVTGSTP